MDRYRRHLGRGFNWLGSATVVAKVIDFSTILVVLLYLTKQQVGIASLVVSVGMVVEACDGWGSSGALIQARTITRLQLDSLFWFIVAAATAMAGLTLLAAPWIAALYGVGGMATYFLAIAAKQPLVGAALIPLALLNRQLQYERIAVVNVCATLAAALTRLTLAVSGAGAWALVAGYASSGLYTLIGAMVARPYRPGLRFRFSAIRGLLHFGLRAAAADIFEQIFKNIDYLLVGWFYGTARLALYRVAFDVAMEPAMAVGTLINRTVLPVFARVVEQPQQFVPALTWSMRRVVVLVAPLMAALLLAASPLTALLHDGQGQSYAAAALPLKLLAAAAFLRVVSQLLTPVLIASGRPGLAARLAATTLALLAGGILAVGFLLPAARGIPAVAGLWLAMYPLLLAWGFSYLRRNWSVRLRDLARTLVVPAAAAAAMTLVVEAARAVDASADPRVQVGIVVVAMAAAYGGLFLKTRGEREAREMP